MDFLKKKNKTGTLCKLNWEKPFEKKVPLLKTLFYTILLELNIFDLLNHFRF